MPDFRYEQFCPLARSAEVLGERWTLLILRELLCGPQRYSDLRRRLPGVSSSVLSQRLERLESLSLVAREQTPPPAPAALYRLTEAGEAARPALEELMRFGVRYLQPPVPGDHLEPEWIPLAMRAFARRRPTPRRVLAVRIPDGEAEVCVRVVGGRRGTRVEAEAEADVPAEATLRVAPFPLFGLLSGLLDPAEAIEAGSLELEGDARAARDLPELFDLRDVMTRPLRTHGTD